MPLFVGVVDQETPACERDDSNSVHRKFDAFVNPNTQRVGISAKDKSNRGWKSGSMGWGVLGHHGSEEADTGAQIERKRPGGLIRTKNGLWVKAPSRGFVTSDEVERAAAKLPGRGRKRRNEFGELIKEPSPPRRRDDSAAGSSSSGNHQSDKLRKKNIGRGRSRSQSHERQRDARMRSRSRDRGRYCRRSSRSADRERCRSRSKERGKGRRRSRSNDRNRRGKQRRRSRSRSESRQRRHRSYSRSRSRSRRRKGSNKKTRRQHRSRDRSRD